MRVLSILDNVFSSLPESFESNIFFKEIERNDLKLVDEFKLAKPKDFNRRRGHPPPHHRQYEQHPEM